MRHYVGQQVNHASDDQEVEGKSGPLDGPVMQLPHGGVDADSQVAARRLAYCVSSRTWAP